VVEGAALEMLCRGNFTEGSNPSLSVLINTRQSPCDNCFTGVLFWVAMGDFGMVVFWGAVRLCTGSRAKRDNQPFRGPDIPNSLS
jgi:hypothetical protein